MTLPGYRIGREADGLTDRERAVLDGLTAGRKQQDIADEMGVSKQRVGQLVRVLERKGAWPPVNS